MNFKNRYYYRTLVIFITLLAISLNLSVIFATDLLSIGKITPYNTYLNISGLMYVSSTNVGIGTANPSSTLHVVGSATITNGLTVSGGTVSLPNGQINDAEISDLSWTKLKNYPASCGAGKAIQALGDTLTCVDVNPSNGITGSGTSGRLAKFTGTNTIGNSGISDSSDAVAITIDSSENVGIGTTTPAYKLDVNGQVRIQTLNAGSTNTVVTHSSGVLQTRTIDSRVWGSSLVDYSGTSANYIPKMSDTNTITNSVIYESGGNVGIGTTSPAQKLHVAGNIKLSNNGFVDNWVTLGSTHGSSSPYPRRWYKVYELTGTGRGYEDIEVRFQGDTNYYDAGTILRLQITRYSGEAAGKLHVTVTPVSGWASSGFVKVNGGEVWVASNRIWGDISARLVQSRYNPGRILFNTSYVETEPPGTRIDGTFGITSFSSDDGLVRYHSMKAGSGYFSGNVGIGTTSPDNKLEVNGAVEIQVDNADSKLRFHDPGDAWYSMGIDRSDGTKFKINYGGNIGDASHFTMDHSGNVGIGTTAPADKLDVNGDVRVRGGDIKDSGGTARITFSGTNIILSLG